MSWHAFELSEQHAHLLYLLAKTWHITPDRAIEHMTAIAARGCLSVHDWLESVNAQEPHDR